MCCRVCRVWEATARARARARLPLALPRRTAPPFTLTHPAPRSFVWFLCSYIALVLALFFGALRSYKEVPDATVRLMLVISAVFYVSGFAFLWLPDKLMCERVQPMQFHALFHLTSTVGPWYLIQHVCVRRAGAPVFRPLRARARAPGVISPPNTHAHAHAQPRALHNPRPAVSLPTRSAPGRGRCRGTRGPCSRRTFAACSPSWSWTR